MYLCLGWVGFCWVGLGFCQILSPKPDRWPADPAETQPDVVLDWVGLGKTQPITKHRRGWVIGYDVRLTYCLSALSKHFGSSVGVEHILLFRRRSEHRYICDAVDVVNDPVGHALVRIFPLLVRYTS